MAKLKKGTPEWAEYQERAQAALAEHPSISAREPTEQDLVREHGALAQAVKDGPENPLDTERAKFRKASWEYGGTTGKIMAGVDKFLEALEYAGGMAGPGPAVYGGQAAPKVFGRPPVKTIDRKVPYILGRDVPLDRAYKDFVDAGNGKGRGLSSPSMYGLPYDRTFAEEGGYRGRGIDENVSVAYMMNPETFRAGPKTRTLWFGKDASTGTSKDLQVRTVKHLPDIDGALPTTEKIRQALTLPENKSLRNRHLGAMVGPTEVTERDAVHYIGQLMDKLSDGVDGKVSRSALRRRGTTSFAADFPDLGSLSSPKMLDKIGVTPRDLEAASQYWMDSGVSHFRGLTDNFATNDRDFDILSKRQFSSAVAKGKPMITLRTTGTPRKTDSRGMSFDYRNEDGRIDAIPIIGDREYTPQELTERMRDVIGYAEVSRYAHPDTFIEAKNYRSFPLSKVQDAVGSAYIRMGKSYTELPQETRDMIDKLESTWDTMGIRHLRVYPEGYSGTDPLQGDLGFHPTSSEAQILLAPRMDVKGGEARAASKGSEKPRESTAPTDEQIREALEFLRMFRENEKPSNEFEATALDRIEQLIVRTMENGESGNLPVAE